MADVTIKVSDKFSTTPGGRYRKDFIHSGEEFFEDVVRARLLTGDRLTLDLDGVVGYPPSFWSEVFKRTLEEFGVLGLDRILLQARKSPFFVAKAEALRARAKAVFHQQRGS